jgi:hypothetical protein
LQQQKQYEEPRQTGKFKKGDHVQWRFRSGTRAGFVEEVGVPPNKSGKTKGTSGGLYYRIKQEKNDALLVKAESTLSEVKGESGMSKEDIVSKDQDIKEQKTGGKRKAEEVEPAENLESKTITRPSRGRASSDNNAAAETSVA